MPKVYVTNTSTRPLETVAKIAFPMSLEMPEHPAIDAGSGQVIPLVLDRDVGDISQIFTAKGIFAPGKNEYELINFPGASSQEFQFSNWVSKDPIGSIPVVIINYADGRSKRMIVGPKSRLVNINPNTATFYLESRVDEGFRTECWATAYSQLDHIEFKLATNWADRNNPQYHVNVSSIRIECRDKFVVHYQSQFGLGPVVYNPLIDTWSLEIPIPSQTIRDGQGIELRGYVLANPENFLTEITPEIRGRLDNLRAVELGLSQFGGVGEVHGSFENMNHSGNWFHAYLPLSINWDQSNRFRNILAIPSLFSPRMIGIANATGQTGAQQDFGADKGYEATVYHDNEWQTYYKGAMIDRMRFFNIHEPDGSRVLKESHPLRITWNMETFDILTRDTLGKAHVPWRDAGIGMFGYDTQHRSMNNLLTYIALTGDELALTTLENALEADLQQARNLDLAEREVGRTFSCWAKMLRVLKSVDRMRLKSHVETKFAELQADWRGRFYPGDPSKPIKVLQVIADPRSGIVNPATNTLECSWIPYQTAEMAKGLYAMWDVLRDPNMLVMLKDVLTTVVLGGAKLINGQWVPLTFARYPTGLPSGQFISKGQTAPDEGKLIENMEPWEYTVGSPGFWDWMAPAIAIAKHIAPNVRDRATEILNSIYPNGRFGSMDTAEWFCTSL
jgi:hypothetical protein